LLDDLDPKKENRSMKVSKFGTGFPESGSLPSEFDLIDIRLFLNIAERKSLTQGAEHSYMSAPAASVRIKHIEERLGTKLLYRTSQGVSPTAAGQVFIRHGRLVLEQLRLLQHDLRNCVQGVKGQLRIIAEAGAITESLPSVLCTYLATHRDVNIELREDTSLEVVRALLAGTVEIGIIEGDSDSNQQKDGLERFPYWTERLVLATPRNHPFAHRTQVAFDDTLSFDYIALAGSSPIQAFLNRVAGISQSPMKIRAQVGHFEALCQLVASGVGVGLLPESAARRYAQTAAICVVKLSDCWASRDLQVCVRDLESLPAFAKDFIDVLRTDGLTAAAA
jgi:DNA-binding transcriptional LysR family regulator